MRKLIIISIIISIASLSLLIGGCSLSDRSMGFVFGTTYELQLRGGKVKQAKTEIIQELTYIENTLSVNIEGSDLYRLNHSLADELIEVSPLTIEMFTISQTINTESGNAFNPAVYPLVKLWQFYPDSDIIENRQPPTQEAINEILPFCLMDYFTVDSLNMTISRSSESAELDFGGIAKGYAVQRAIDIMNKHNIRQGLINIGGNVGIVGKEIKVGIRNPRDSEKICIASFTMLDNESVATSGDYERFFIHEDVRYHHIINPSVGKPVNNGVIAVTVVSDNATLADAMSTAIFCMGAKDGLEFANSKGIKCLIVMSNKTYYITDNFNAEILEEGYTKADINEN